jgi:hypothetical protein
VKVRVTERSGILPHYHPTDPQARLTFSPLPRVARWMITRYSGDSIVVGRIFKAHAVPEGSPWMWTLAFGQHEDRTPTHGYEPTREAAMAAFAKSWRRELGPVSFWRYSGSRPVCRPDPVGRKD